MQNLTERILSGKRAIVTGAAGDIGAAISYELANAGALVALLDCDTVGLEQTAAQIQAITQKCLVKSVDLKDTDAIAETVAELLALHPHWDILVNNAAVVVRGSLLEFAIDDWDLLFQVNLRAVFVLSRLIAPGMIAQHSGKIINISSNATFYGTPGSGAYATSKAGLNQLTKTMAIEWGVHNLQINAICPGLTNTKLLRKVWQNPINEPQLQKFIDKVPLGRLLEPDELSPLVLFLAGPGSGYINGAMFQVDDGARYNPGI